MVPTTREEPDRSERQSHITDESRETTLTNTQTGRKSPQSTSRCVWEQQQIYILTANDEMLFNQVQFCAQN